MMAKSRLPINEIINDYQVNKVSLNGLERKYEVSVPVIKRCLIEMGVQLRTKRECYDLNKLSLSKQIRDVSKQTALLLPSKRRFAILARDGFRCRYCGRSAQDGIELVVEHIIAKSRGGDDNPANLITACKGCNNSKGATSLVTNNKQIPSFILITTNRTRS